MIQVQVAADLVERTLDEVRVCGRGRRECVVYWLADRGALNVVVELVHPDHRAGEAWYEVDDRWLTAFSFDLADSGLSAVAQLHTHPGTLVGHSGIDDEFVLVPTPGFVSVVVPDYGRIVDRATWAVHVLEPAGTWRLDPDAVAW